ncbi:MAG: hypothetical protein K2N65_03255, partial [Anaeroplasmataceae bacterium]|nr:hypothetical protein [Anaeroplasmataceae bacterium]
MKVEQYLLKILETDLKEYDSYVVGEAILKYMLGKPIEEYEVITSAPLFSMPKGKKIGSKTMVYSSYPKPILIHFMTSKEEYYKGCHFTYETLLYHPHLGIVDPYHAVLDIQHQRLTSLKLPTHPMDVMRGIALKESIGFHFDEALENWILTHTFPKQIENPKGFFSFFQRILLSDFASLVLKQYSLFFETYFPISGQGLEIMKYTRSTFILRFAGLLWDTPINEISDFFIQYKITACSLDEIELLLTYKDYNLTESNLKGFQKLIGKSASSWFAVKRAEALALGKIEAVSLLD